MDFPSHFELTRRERRGFPAHPVVPARWSGIHCPDAARCDAGRENPACSAFLLEENLTIGRMSVFPRISLRLEVENYLKEGFMNKEVGQLNM